MVRPPDPVMLKVVLLVLLSSARPGSVAVLVISEGALPMTVTLPAVVVKFQVGIVALL